MGRRAKARTTVKTKKEEERKRKLEDTEYGINAVSVTRSRISSGYVCEGISILGQLRWATPFPVLRS